MNKFDLMVMPHKLQYNKVQVNTNLVFYEIKYLKRIIYLY
jgi:hypothetical protein